jgi:hypothetical protein
VDKNGGEGGERVIEHEPIGIRGILARERKIIQMAFQMHGYLALNRYHVPRRSEALNVEMLRKQYH